MFTCRLCGGVSVMSTPSSTICPVVGRSKPAIIRRVVVLPQPDGAQQREELAARNVQVDVVHGPVRAEELVEVE